MSEEINYSLNLIVPVKVFFVTVPFWYNEPLLHSKPQLLLRSLETGYESTRLKPVVFILDSRAQRIPSLHHFISWGTLLQNDFE
jgi:hypothetical protein